MTYLSSIRLFTPETYGQDKFMKKVCQILFPLPLLLLASCESKEQKTKETCLLESVEQISTPEAMKRLSISKIDHLLDWKLVERFCNKLEQPR